MSSLSDRSLNETVDELARQTLARGESLRVRVTTPSMAPIIQPGETIIVAPVEPESLALGDIVLLEYGDAWVAHRLVARNAQGEWLTKGDRTLTCDTIAAREWLGRVVAIETARARLALTRGRGFAACIAWVSYRAAQAHAAKRSFTARVWRMTLRLFTFTVRAWLAGG